MGYPRQHRPHRSQFGRSTFDQQRKAVMAEIKRLGGTSVIISTNLPLRLDGMPQASARMPEDKGVAIYFNYKNQQVVFACDKWDSMTDNMKAIEKAIYAIRGLERWGVSDMLNRAFVGFKQLAEAEPSKSSWEILDIPVGSPKELIQHAYRQKAKELHPDMPGGNVEKFQELQLAYNNLI